MPWTNGERPPHSCFKANHGAEAREQRTITPPAVDHPSPPRRAGGPESGGDFRLLQRSARPYPWQVVHACERARDVLSLVEGQLAAGMRPFLLTPAGFGSARAFLEAHRGEGRGSVSLLKTWNHVREWRRLLNQSAAESTAEIVHAHSFAAGMAAVRASWGVVYQFGEPVEKLAALAGNCDESSWLARSFRAAEQFVLTRAAAVIVKHSTEREACLQRGVSADHLFLIPEPVDLEMLESCPDRKWLESMTGARAETLVFVIPETPNAGAWERHDALRRWMRVLSIVHREHSDIKFVFLAEGPAADDIYQLAFACNLAPVVKVLTPEQHSKALASADVVICDREHASTARSSIASSPQPALEAFARGRALLAADVAEHREISSEGSGCLWFRAGDVADLSHRASFLVANPHFRCSLAAAARAHCATLRSPEAVGGLYDAVYRLAFSKRKDRDSSTPTARLIPLQASG